LVRKLAQSNATVAELSASLQQVFFH